MIITEQRLVIAKRHWAVDDDYLVIPLQEVQVLEQHGFKEGDIVIVTVSMERSK